MITKIIHASDIHIHNYRRLDEYQIQLQKFIDKCKKIADENGVDNTRIVIAGDLIHSKTELSPEGYTLSSWFLKQLDEICKTIVIAGNHDITQNLSRLDPLSVIFSMCKFKQVHYLDQDLGYQSGMVEDDNIMWCLYSVFDDFNKPEDINIIERSGKTFVGLFHGDLKSAKTDAGYVSENGLDGKYFDGIDFGLFGHIHKRQCVKINGIPLAYSGSLIQQDFGENISCHGFLLWNVEERTYEEINLNNDDYGFYTFSIDEKQDLEIDKEEIINL